MTEDEPIAIACRAYCFQGQRGMDTCSKCGGTGSQLFYKGEYAPNTEEGWNNLLKLKRRTSDEDIL